MDTEQIVFDKKEFKKTMVMPNKMDVKCVKNIDKGKYGTVLEVKHSKYVEKVGSKVCSLI